MAYGTCGLIEYLRSTGPESWLFGNAKEYIRYVDRDGRVGSYLTPNGRRRLTFDLSSRMTQIDDVVGATTKSHNFAYDASGQLTSFSGFTSASPSESQTFTYDVNGNRLTATLNGVVRSHTYASGTNRLASVTQAGATVMINTFDAAGNTLSDGTRSFVYDARGRLVQSVSAGLTSTYLYNGDGQRVKKSNASQTRVFVYDGAGHMIGEYNEAGSPIQELVWLGDTPVAVIFGSTVGNIWTDHLNTPREITNAANQTLWKWDSLPFGETLPNENPSGLGSFSFNHRFPGQYFDYETGLHQNTNRDYDPINGRYIESDSVGLAAGPNLFVYALNNPVMRSDRLGLDSLSCPVPRPECTPSKILEIQVCLSSARNFYQGTLVNCAVNPKIPFAACATGAVIQQMIEQGRCVLQYPECIGKY